MTQGTQNHSRSAAAPRRSRFSRWPARPGPAAPAPRRTTARRPLPSLSTLLSLRSLPALPPTARPEKTGDAGKPFEQEMKCLTAELERASRQDLKELELS